MPWLEHPDSIASEVHFPFTRLSYTFDEENSFPVSVELRAFSPFIPLDAKNSGLPLAFFTFSVQNQSMEDLEVSLLGGLRNLTGYTYSKQASIMDFQCGETAAWMQMSRAGLPADASDNGTLALAVIEENAGQTRMSSTRAPAAMYGTHST